MVEENREFEKWLELNTDLAEKTIKNYVSAIKKVSNDLVDSELTHLSLGEVTDTEELRTIKDRYFSIA